MGFFSFNCKCCKKSILSPYSINRVNAWMNEAVVITKRGSKLAGKYDGYGRVEGMDITKDMTWPDNGKPKNTPAVYHAACWFKAGMPMAYKRGSSLSADQGYFIDPKKYNKGAPT